MAYGFSAASVRSTVKFDIGVDVLSLAFIMYVNFSSYFLALYVSKLALASVYFLSALVVWWSVVLFMMSILMEKRSLPNRCGIVSHVIF